MKKNKFNLYLIVFLPIQIVLVKFLQKHPDWIETYYSKGIYISISTTLRFLFGWIPFSIADVLLIIGSFCIIRSIYILIKNRFKTILISIYRTLALLSLLHFCFYAFWGLNYFRNPLSKELNLNMSSYDTSELVKTTDLILNDLHYQHLKIVNNDSVMIKVPYSSKQIYEKASLGFEKLSINNSNFDYKNISVKSSLLSIIQSFNGTSGYINPLTNEAQINDLIPKPGMPATVCHEIAHQIGWAAENEANYIGFLTSIVNDDIYFKYSGYRMAFRYCYRELVKKDKKQAKIIWDRLHSGIKKELSANIEHWKKFKNPFQPYIRKSYDSYLKINNQTKGIYSYNYVVNLLVNHYKTLN